MKMFKEIEFEGIEMGMEHIAFQATQNRDLTIVVVTYSMDGVFHLNKAILNYMKVFKNCEIDYYSQGEIRLDNGSKVFVISKENGASVASLKSENIDMVFSMFEPLEDELKSYLYPVLVSRNGFSYTVLEYKSE